MGSAVGAEKSAAVKIGCSLEFWREQRAAGHRWCYRCKTWNILEAMQGRVCKPCNSAKGARSRYGLSEAAFASIIKTETCPICQRAGQKMEIDHNHATARVRSVRRKVFCASLADVFDNKAPAEWRLDLWVLIANTPHLDWLLLTKRPQNIAAMLPDTWRGGWPNVWLGSSAENQEEYDRRRLHLLAVPARVHFFSVEPMLGPVLRDLANERGKNVWYICGGESGRGRRPMQLEWARELRDDCANARIPFFMKQIDKIQPIPDDLMIRQFPEAA